MKQISKWILHISFLICVTLISNFTYKPDKHLHQLHPKFPRIWPYLGQLLLPCLLIPASSRRIDLIRCNTNFRVLQLISSKTRSNIGGEKENAINSVEKENFTWCEIRRVERIELTWSNSKERRTRSEQRDEYNLSINAFRRR